MAVAISSVLNFFGDYYLVAVRGMGAAGAALATVVSQGISVIICILIIRRRGLPFDFGVKNIRLDRELARRTLKIGYPIALQDLLVSISFAVLIAITNSLGLIESAGVGVAERVCGFIMLLPSAFSQALSAFVAQNVGARKFDRADKALFCGIASSLTLAVFVFWFSFFHGEILTGIFANDPAVVLAGAEYLKAYAIDSMLTSFLFCFHGYFNGCGKTRFIMLEGLIGAFGIRIPVAFIMSRQTPVSLFHIGLATPCSTLVQITLCLIFFAYNRKKMRAGETR